MGKGRSSVSIPIREGMQSDMYGTQSNMYGTQSAAVEIAWLEIMELILGGDWGLYRQRLYTSSVRRRVYTRLN